LSTSIAFVLRSIVAERAIGARITTSKTTRSWQPLPILSVLPPLADFFHTQDAYNAGRDTLKNIAILGACLLGLTGLVGAIFQIVLPRFLASVAEDFGKAYPEFWKEQAVPLMAKEGNIRDNPQIFFTIVTKLLKSEEPEVWEKCVAGKLKPGENLGDRFDLVMAVQDELERIDDTLDEEVEKLMKAEAKSEEEQKKYSG